MNTVYPSLISPLGEVQPQTDVALIVISGSTSGLPGDNLQLTAVCKDAAGNVLTGKTVQWATMNPAVASVDNSGKVSLIYPGQVSIVARVDRADDFQIPGSAVLLTVKDPNTVDPVAGDVLVFDGPKNRFVPTNVTNSIQPTVDGARPGNGRTVPTLAQYLLNNAHCNVKDFGAAGDGTVDDYWPIMNAQAVAVATGRWVYFPAGTYKVGFTIMPATKSKWRGDGMGVSIIDDHATLGANPIFSAQATAASPLKDLWFKDLTITNGVASTGAPTAGKDGLDAKYVDGLKLDDVEFTEIQGSFGLSTRRCSRITVSHGRFYRCTYAQFYVLNDCDTVRVEDTTFDTATSLTEPNTYLFAAGGDGSDFGGFFCKNVWLTRCKFLNNPRWEGIDFHGGENIWVTDCYAENCKTGLLLGCASGFVSNPVMKNATITNLIAKCGNGLADGAGIVMQGTSDRTVLAENITIIGGRLDGFGGTSSTLLGAITVAATRNLKVRGLTIDNYLYSGVCLTDWVLGVDLEEITFRDCANPDFNANTAAVALRSVGAYGVRVEACILTPGYNKAPNYFLGTSQASVSVQLGMGARANRVLNVKTGRYLNAASLPVEKSAIPTTQLRQQYGDVVQTNTGKPGWYCATPTVGYGSLDTTTVVCTASIASGSNVATISASGLDYRSLPPGMNITIVGAGVAGADLQARVMSNDVTTITLNVSAGTTVSGASVKYQACTLVTA